MKFYREMMASRMNGRTDLEFLLTGLLPATPLIHPVTLAELHGYFVERFQQSQTRARLYDNFVRYLKLLNVFVGLYGVIINGSYVTNKADPRDIDISPLVVGSVFEKLPREYQEAVNLLIDPSTRIVQLLRCHPLYVPFIYPAGHKRRKRNDEVLQESKAFWSRARSGLQKGIVYLRLDEDWRHSNG